MSSIFNFQRLLTIVLQLICTCTYIRSLAPSLLDKDKTALLSIFWKLPELVNKSPYVVVCCVVMAFSIPFRQ
ncbi:protein kish-A-like [Choloepus didactylus]|uniref:protein kish-A-like n=1 Tax=Choloepus didactylus TaxID=27675 RepID=UPI00189FAB3B|nr:protein kish-A-like [Choloepus didactylus]